MTKIILKFLLFFYLQSIQSMKIQSNMHLIYNFEFSHTKFSCLWGKRAGISKFFLSVFNLSIDLTWAVDDLQETEPARTLKPFLPNLLIGKKQCAADKIVLINNVSKKFMRVAKQIEIH